MQDDAHHPARDLGEALRDRNRAFLVQAQQHLRPLVAEDVHEAVVQAAIARPGIERQVRYAERANRQRDRVAAEADRAGVDADR